MSDSWSDVIEKVSEASASKFEEELAALKVTASAYDPSKIDDNAMLVRLFGEHMMAAAGSGLVAEQWRVIALKDEVEIVRRLNAWALT